MWGSAALDVDGFAFNFESVALRSKNLSRGSTRDAVERHRCLRVEDGAAS